MNIGKRKTMELILKLNARFQPKHRFELEDVLQELLGRLSIYSAVLLWKLFFRNEAEN